MDLDEHFLAWPRTLFVWEAVNLLLLADDPDFPRMVQHLAREAFDDEALAEELESAFRPVSGGDSPASTGVDRAKSWLYELTTSPSKLTEYRAPRYWAERHSGTVGLTNEPLRRSLAQEWTATIDELEQTGYFPRILPVICIDDHYMGMPSPIHDIRRATGLDVPWPITGENADSLSEAAVFTLIEYFHDQAQRPRDAELHHFNNCGLHYSRFNRSAGGTVYRWRVNGLLERHGVPYRLGMEEEERGRLVHTFGDALDETLAEEAGKREEDPTSEVAHAVHMFRARDATTASKRAAVMLLHRDIELRGPSVRRAITKKSEGELYNIANNFNIRHSDSNQLADYDDDFLDWIFVNHLAAVRLMRVISERVTTTD